MKLLVIDDHPLIREAVSHVAARLDPSAHVHAVADAEAGFELVDRDPAIELLVLDLHLRGLSGVAAIRAWRHRHPALPVVVLSGDESRATVLAAMEAGAAGFIPKSSSNEVMLSALHLVLSGGRYLPPQLLNAMPAPQPPRLSSRQQEILHMLAAGKTNKCICAELGLAERTVKAHITEVLRILGVHSRTQAALVAVRMGLDQTPPPPSP